MAGITLQKAEEMLDKWLAAETAIAERGQSYTIEGRTLTRADLSEIRDSINFWDEKVKALGGATLGVRQVIACRN